MYIALYKVGSGEDITKAEQPGTFDLKVSPVPTSDHQPSPSTSSNHKTPLIQISQGKAKKRAWQKVVDEGLSQEQAQAAYVKLVEQLKETYGYDANKAPEAVGGA